MMRTTSSHRRGPVPSRRRPAAGSAAGFTLVELLVTMGILLLVILGVLALFDLNSRIARTQTHMAEMQQSQRVAQQSIIKLTRMAGRGGLPLFDEVSGVRLPAGVALGVANNVAGGVQLGGSAEAQVLEGTDVLTVRGVFTAPIYHSDPLNPAVFVPPSGAAGTLILRDRTPTGAPQPLEDVARVVRRAQAGNGRDALLMVNARGEHAVVEILGGSTSPPTGSPVTQVQISFIEQGGDNTAAYTGLSYRGAYPAGFDQVTYAGVLEEYRFYVRDRRANTSDTAENVLPQLARARLFPNTNLPYVGDAANLTEVVADNILDLQVALGVDRDTDDFIREGIAGGTPAPDDDDWLFNDGGDSADPDLWNVAGRDLFYVRINTLARTDRPTPQYQADELRAIEDNDYSVLPFARYNTFEERTYHRRLISTVIDLRNL
jgi:type II secretory pathway pseudopilin PulG